MGHDTAGLGGELEPSDRAQDEDPFRVAVDAAGMGTWDWHIPSGRVIWTPRTYRFFGVQPGSFPVSWESVIGRVHAADRPMVPALLACIGTADGWDAELIGCLLRAEGYVVLTMAEKTTPAQFAEIAERVRACFVALVMGRSTPETRSSGLSAAADIAARRHGVPVCISCDERLQVPAGVNRVRSVREVGSFLRRLQRVS